MPHTGLAYDPQHTDWEFLIPLELSDYEMTTPGAADTPPRATPIISGFIALIKVFLCVVDLLDRSFPGPPAYFSMSQGGIAPRLLGFPVQTNCTLTAPSDIPQLEGLLQVMTRLDSTLSDLPDPLRLPHRGTAAGSPEVSVTRISPQFETMRANIHITAIYFQSLILEMCLNRLSQTGSSPGVARDTNISSQLWQMKESVARELLDIISCSSPVVIESNGLSMVLIDPFHSFHFDIEEVADRECSADSKDQRDRRHVSR